jgi:hypothetical protein
MKTRKNIINLGLSLMAGMITFSLAYLLGAFYNCSFNPCYWIEDSRAAVSILGGITSIIVITLAIMTLSYNKSE